LREAVIGFVDDGYGGRDAARHFRGSPKALNGRISLRRKPARLRHGHRAMVAVTPSWPQCGAGLDRGARERDHAGRTGVGAGAQEAVVLRRVTGPSGPVKRDFEIAFERLSKGVRAQGFDVAHQLA